MTIGVLFRCNLQCCIDCLHSVVWFESSEGHWYELFAISYFDGTCLAERLFARWQHCVMLSGCFSFAQKMYILNFTLKHSHENDNNLPTISRQMHSYLSTIARPPTEWVSLKCKSYATEWPLLWNSLAIPVNWFVSWDGHINDQTHLRMRDLLWKSLIINFSEFENWNGDWHSRPIERIPPPAQPPTPLSSIGNVIKQNQ